MDSGKERPNNFAKRTDYIAEPGSYAVEPKFGENAKGFRITKSPKPKSQPKSIGPGDYDVERAEEALKVRNPAAKLDSGKERPNNFAKPVDNRAEPGSYAVEFKFGENAKGFRITKSPEPKPQTNIIGPGDYDIDKALAHTKARIIEVKIDPLPSNY